MELKGYQQHVLGELKDYIAAVAASSGGTGSRSVCRDSSRSEDEVEDAMDFNAFLNTLQCL